LLLKKTSAKKQEAIDITREIQTAADQNNWRNGALFAFARHCTCALVLNEFEPRICSDYFKLLETLVNKKGWAHNEIDDNAAAHLAACLVGSHCMIPVREGRLALGTWQKIILLEFDGPREREIELVFIETK